MPSTTQLFQMLPWVGGVNTSIDESLIAPNQTTVADNVVYDTRGSKRRRDGINHNWDGLTDSTHAVVGGHDFWFGDNTRTQREVAIWADGTVHSHTSGAHAQLTVVGTPWTGTLTSASMLTFNNKVIMAVSGANNVIKYWDGNLSNPVQDLFSDYGNNLLTRASSGTTRTLVFKEAFGGTVGSTVIVSSVGNSNLYNGTFTVATVATTTIANDTITYGAGSTLTETTATDTAGRVGKPAPLASILWEHLGRIFCNDKTDADRMLYCTTNDHTQWMGIGDSGGFEVRPGDGDPDGLTAGFSFRGDNFICKRTKMYRIVGQYPEDWQIVDFSLAIGCVNHAAKAAIGSDDYMWISDKGLHSLTAVQSYGDFTTSDVSTDIQRTFNTSFDRSRLKYACGAYLPQINSVAFAFTEVRPPTTFNATRTVNNSVWLYNVPEKMWYRWPDLSVQTIWVANDVDKKRFYFGTHTSRISRTFNGTKFDINSSGVHKGIRQRVVTGTIYPNNNNPYQLAALKRFILYYKPQGTHNLAVNVYVDDQTLSATNSLSFNDSGGSDLLGTTFILGSSLLGYRSAMGPRTRTIDGVGSGVKIEFIQSGIEDEVEIQGFALEFEDAGVAP